MNTKIMWMFAIYFMSSRREKKGDSTSFRLKFASVEMVAFIHTVEENKMNINACASAWDTWTREKVREKKI